jgi:nucleotide-binding universal stress UspA family protein
MTGIRPIVVGVDESPGSDAALQWAIAAARAWDLPLRLVYCYHWSYSASTLPPISDVPNPPEAPDADAELALRMIDETVGKLTARAHALDDRVEVSSAAIDGDPSDVLVDESQRASQLVLGSRHLKALSAAVLGSVATATVGRAACPTVVVRGTAGSPAEGAGVVVGVDDTETTDEVLGFAFATASRHGLPLRPVLVWRPEPLALLGWRAEPPAPAKVEAWLSEAIAGWQEKFPDVEVHPEVVREQPVAGLVLAATDQYLLVVGHRGRRTLGSLGSVSLGVLHHATCPVAVVPTRKTTAG